MDGDSGELSVARPAGRDRALQTMLDRLNAARATGINGAWETSAEARLHARHHANHRLAVYGSLGPGRRNHHVLEPLGGEWRPGTVLGRFYPSGWGTAKAYSGIRLDETGDEIPVKILTSESLALEWGRLDAFEGGEYVRLLARVSCAPAGHTVANIYSVRFDPQGTG